jgi:hypothetical protein
VAGNSGLIGFPVEEIPNEDWLYLRVFHAHVEDGEPTAAAFRDHVSEGRRPGMSVNWNRYATAEETRSQGSQGPEKYGVVKMLAGEVRRIQGLSVEHDPEWPNNRAHSEVYGNKRDQEVKVRLMRACYWVIRVGG